MQANYKRSRRPSFNFQEMGIEPGSVLYSINGESTCEVIDEKKVRYNEEVFSLTRATSLMLDVSYNVAPGLYWNYEGRRLRSIYNETYEIEE